MQANKGRQETIGLASFISTPDRIKLVLSHEQTNGKIISHKQTNTNVLTSFNLFHTIRGMIRVKLTLIPKSIKHVNEIVYLMGYQISLLIPNNQNSNIEPRKYDSMNKR